MFRYLPHRCCCRGKSLTGLLISAVLAGLLITSACDTILPPPTDPDTDNPLDPESPSYVAPETYIVSGPAAGSTVGTSTVTFTWEGNEGAIIFQTRLDEGNWSDWLTQTSRTLEYLDEGSYLFEVRSAYPPEQGEPSHIDTSAVSISFVVDAVQGPSLRLSPRLVEVTASQSFHIELIAEEVADLMGVRAVIQFGPAALTVEDVIDGDFLASTGGTVVSQYITDNESGTVEINIAVATGIPPGVSGTGTLAVIQFRGLQVVDTSITFITTTTDLRDHQNQVIVISSLVGTVVRIK